MGFDFVHGFFEQVFLGLHPIERGLAGDGFDAADACGDTAFAGDFEEADVAGACNVCAAAQFGGVVAHRNHAHEVAVFFAKQHHGAGFLCVFDGHGFYAHGYVFHNGVVDAAFYFGDFFGSNRLRVGDVKAREFGVLQRAFLFDVRAEYITQGFVHQVGYAVVAHDGFAHGVIHFGANAVADFQAA